MNATEPCDIEDELIRLQLALGNLRVRIRENTRSFVPESHKHLAEYFARFCPCAHENVNTSLGDRKVWALCHDCGETVSQKSLPARKQEAVIFENNVDNLRKALGL